MHIFFLNGGGAGLLFIGLIIALIFTGVAIVIEAVVMRAFKYNLANKAISDSAIANITSLVVGILFIFAGSNWFHLNDWGGYVAFYFETVLVEGLVLYLRNGQKPFLKTALVCLVMNIFSYPVLYLFSRIGS